MPHAPADPTPTSPNFNARRGGAVPALVVIHYTAMPSCAAARARLCDPAHEVSAHWLIAEDGTPEALVDESLRAWHAGAGAWGGAADVNSRSIGIELANSGDAPFPEPQMAALERLLGQILTRWHIPPEGVIAHSDMAPARKRDPGPRFDWRRLALAGLSVWPDGDTPAAARAEAAGDAAKDIPDDLPAAFRRAASAFGYPDAAPEALLAAFRARFRPWAEGPLSVQDLRRIDSLARHHPSARPAPGT